MQYFYNYMQSSPLIIRSGLQKFFVIMSMKITDGGTKKFSKEEKIAILEEAGKLGVKATLAKYGLYPATFYYWKRQYLANGEGGLIHKKHNEALDTIQKLETENARLKLLLAEIELESKLKDELIKKKYPERRR